MSYDFAVNPQAKAETVFVGREQQPVIVIDDAFAEPASLIEFAVHEAIFAPPSNYYPGLRGEPLPKPYIASLLRAFNARIGKTFGVAIGGALNANFYFGLATVPPVNLSLLQRLPHFDTTNGSQIAALHYLCDGSHGGTAFFRHRATGFESIDEARKPLYFETLKRETGLHPPPARYMAGDDPLYERTGGFDAKFNRLLLYRSRILHSGSVNPANLSSDPRKGRLTANLFLAYGEQPAI